jgi:hypothetical protein
MEPPGDDPDKKKAAAELARQELEAGKRVQPISRVQAAWNRNQDERLEEVRRDAGRQQYMKLNHPDEYQRDMKERQRRAERDAAQQAIRGAQGRQAPTNRWTNELSDYSRAAVAATERGDREAREGPVGQERKGH